MLSNGRNFLKAAAAAEHTTEYTIERAGQTTDLGVTSQPDWSNPVSVGTVKGTSPQPASKDALELAGLTGRSDIVTIFLNPVTLQPKTYRLTAAGGTYLVQQVQPWGSHTVVIAERS